MRIAGQDATNNARRTETTARSAEVSRTRAPEDAASTNEVSTTDRVELSSQARTIQQAREVAQNAPEVRQERVDQARQGVQDGTVPRPDSDVADRLLQDALPG